MRDALKICGRSGKLGSRHTPDETDKGFLNEITCIIPRTQARLKIASQPRGFSFVDMPNVADIRSGTLLSGILAQPVWGIAII
ncbi:hypothetical protein Sbs19_35170 [Sphingobium sp. BS19]|nr:hypothetical protein Sbs19_35170 [Sphingobium sp. BS19]